MIRLAASYTPGYPWVGAFYNSVCEYGAFPFGLLQVVEDTPRADSATLALPSLQVPKAEETRTTMLQHGAFLPYLPSLVGTVGADRNEVILFSDADMIMQRPFAPAELALFEGLGLWDVAIGLNGPRGETLFDEAKLLGPKVHPETLDDLFPGWAELLAWNTGFVAARRSAWQRLYDMCRALLPIAEACFEHYAAVQWVMCYAVQKWLKHVELPQTIHCHGCWGMPVGASFDDEGRVLFGGELVAFRHAINLNPPKGVAWRRATAPAAREIHWEDGK
jgi:hypothetical protein